MMTLREEQKPRVKTTCIAVVMELLASLCFARLATDKSPGNGTPRGGGA